MMSRSTQSVDRDFLETQWRLIQSIHQEDDSLQLVDKTLEQLSVLGDLDAAWVWFNRDGSDDLLLKSARGLSPELSAEISHVPSDSALGCQVGLGTDIVQDWARVWGTLGIGFLRDGWTEVAVWPIRADGRVVGALGAAQHGSKVFTPEAVILNRIVALELGECVGRLRAEGALRSSRNNLVTLFDALDDFVLIVGQDGRVVSNNSGLGDRAKFPTNGMADTPIDELLPGVSPSLKQAFGEPVHLENLESPPFHGQRMLNYDGHRIPVELKMIPGQWDDRPVVYLVCRDTTERQVLEEERNRLVTAIEQAAESIVITTSTGRIQYVNPAFCKVTGYERDEVIGGAPSLLKSGRQDEAFYADLWTCISRGEVWSGRIVNSTKTNEEFIEEATISPVRDENGIITHFVAVKRNVSNEIELEERLFQSQKMEALGTLAGGIAHDFNNILYAVIGYAQLALEDVGPDHAAVTALEEINKAGDRAAGLVAKMLTLGRRADSGHKALDLKPFIDDAMDLARASLPATVSFEVDLPDIPMPVMVDAGQIQQVLLNLCSNAEQAMSEGTGALSVSGQVVELTTEDAQRWSNLKAGSWVCLKVSDTGTGMERPVLDRIFEPYYTTKKPNEGTGLGLATVHGIVTNHGGRVFVESEPQKGSCFTVFLPVYQDKTREAHDVEAPTSEVTSLRDTEAPLRILVIDDEKIVVDVTTRGLTKAGFEVTGIMDGVHALEVFRSDPDAFDVILTDQTMPSITGFEVAAELLSIRPDLPIILTTGNCDQLSQAKIRETGLTCVLPKPLRLKGLVAAVREAAQVPVAG